jgi:hypothetical protein
MTSNDLYKAIEAICEGDELIIKKKSKAGFKDVDMLPYVRAMNFTSIENELCFNVTLPAGNTKNIGLPLVLKAIENKLEIEIDYNIVKLNMFTEEMAPFA